MAESISIFDIIKRGGYEASLITTFNATLPFYEEVVLRKLVSAGCRHNVVLIDQGQCAQVWDAEASRPRLAGYAYTLVPVGVSGAFHPKVCLLIGPKKASILIGSHNLTLSGFGNNREVTNWIEVEGTNDLEGTALLSTVWKMVHRWIELARYTAPDSLIEIALSLSNFITPLTVKPGVAQSAFALDQAPGGPRLIDQVIQKIPNKLKRIGVIGPFFDDDLAFISELKRNWPTAQLVVGIDPDSVHLTAIPKPGEVTYVDARQLWINDRGYLHAKVIFFDSGVAYTRVFVSGSANPSRPAWMSTATSGNVEAVLLRTGADAQNAAEKIGMLNMFALQTIDARTFKSISHRSMSIPNSDDTHSIPVWLGTTDLTTSELRISCRSKPIGIEHIMILGPNMEVLEDIDSFTSDENTIIIHPNVELSNIRSCTLWREGSVVIRVMIQHPNSLYSSLRSSRQYQIRTALNSLGSGEGDISKVIASVERVIFSDETNKEINAAVREHHEKRNSEVKSVGLDTLAVSISELSKTRKKSRLLKSGDLAYLIDVLLRRLSEGLETQVVDTDSAGRIEEEQIGMDDGDISDSSTLLQQDITLNDFNIAVAVSRRSRSLTRRMVDQLRLAVTDETRQTSAIFQLIAVLALLRELRHLDTLPRWRKTGHTLSTKKDRQYLLDESVKYLLSSNSHLIDTIDKETGGNTEESVQLRVLLLWLAWDLGEELTEEVNRIWDSKERKTKLFTNSVFLKLMPGVSLDDTARVELEQSISRTTKSTPEAAKRATEWLNRHLSFGSAWSVGIRDCEDLKVGGYCRVPGIADEPHVIVEVSDKSIGFCDHDRVRKFMRDRVVGVTSV